ncbi:hypothetical protein C8J56DRAFT_449531 [Mycena floridula]|nr:hypothetical protein C8J56DRAFT_449531 [Mycena floridula]
MARSSSLSRLSLVASPIQLHFTCTRFSKFLPMTSCATSPFISHPWFSSSNMKRQREEEEKETSSSTKRVRYNALTQSLAHLSLTQSPSTSTPSATGQVDMDVDEPARPLTPEIRDLKMKTFSWYEPEPDRIVVTNLDSSDEEDETAPISISPAALDHIRSRQIISATKPSPQSHALVLYRPLVIPPKEEETASSMDVEA